MKRWIIPLLWLAGCGPGEEPDQDADPPPKDDPVKEAKPPALPDYAGKCGEIGEGTNTLEVDGRDRTFEVWLPAKTKGAPVVLAWHYLGGNPTQYVNWWGLDALTDEGAIVLAPRSKSVPNVEWDTWEGDDSDDLLFFDAMVHCAWKTWEVDTTRIHATGFSAGGLWMSTLTQHRSEWLASVAPFSGGSTQFTWRPEEPIPMLVTWGGPTDLYGTFSFEDSSETLLTQLADNDQFAVQCVHNAGHDMPPTGWGYLWPFFEAHPQGELDAWKSGLPGVVPSMCTLP